MHRIPLVAILVLALAAALLVGCAAKKPEPGPPPPPVVTPTPQPDKPFVEKTPETLQPSDADYFNKQGVLKDINYDTDKWDITPAARAILKENAAWLLAHPEFRLSIEGHCDERNTESYNLALGERRANAAKEYLIGLGVPGDRLSTVSYGKARPVCTQATEDCWAKNRRAHFMLMDKK